MTTEGVTEPLSSRGRVLRKAAMSSASETWEWVGRCDSCGGKFPTDATGRPRRYCSGACRQRAYRRRRGVATAAEAYRRGQGWALHLGDAAEVMRYLPAESVQTVVTSPPYYQLRDYRGHPDQLGMEPTVQEYIDRLVDVFREAARVLRPDGALWVNIGDTYSSRANRNPARHTGRGHRDGITAPRARSTDVAPVKSLLLVPSRLAIALQEDGWIIRNMGVWHKRNGTPESVTDRLARRHETLILATRRPRYSSTSTRSANHTQSPRCGGHELGGQTLAGPHARACPTRGLRRLRPCVSNRPCTRSGRTRATCGRSRPGRRRRITTRCSPRRSLTGACVPVHARVTWCSTPSPAAPRPASRHSGTGGSTSASTSTRSTTTQPHGDSRRCLSDHRQATTATTSCLWPRARHEGGSA